MIGAVVVESLAVARGERLLFERLGLAVRAGEAVALVGRNGAGKTTLLRVIAGLEIPEGGRVLFAGRTAWEELLFQVRWTGGTLASAEAACARLGLSRLRDLEVRKLSAGQRRRLALARLVAAPRSLWLLDEPLAPLDTEQRDLIGAR